MRIVFVGTLESSWLLLEVVLANPEARVVGVVTRSRAPGNADFRSLAPLAERAGCPCLAANEEPDVDLAAWIAELEPDVVYCFGWSWLLPARVLGAAPLGVIGYHPTLLPANRGRHPIIWALALGLERTGSTFFRMDEGADSGDILAQEEVAITRTDDAHDLYGRLMTVACRQIMELTTELAEGRALVRPQDDARANVWRKRGPADGLVDWRMPAEGIYNLIRALSRPYVGAHCLWREREVKLWRAQPGPQAPNNIEPGKVLEVEGSRILVKCGVGSLYLAEHEFDILPKMGEYL